ncbi:protein amalgam-like [Liolophura sinensis]|uniref:protein amalgam-like n=1 Tax=Liolophura sinensis TaxID=3198878 RepID=UPI0031597C78
MAPVIHFLTVLIAFFGTGTAVDPIIDISEPAVVAGVTEIQAWKGRDVDLVCVVQNKPADTNVMWLQKSGEQTPVKVLTTDTTSQEPQKYSVFKPTSISWRLRIQNIEEGDEGLYLCRVETQPKTYISKSRYVRVVEIPQIDSLQTSSDKAVEEGAELSLDCNASGRPAPAIVWTRLANADLPGGGKELRSTHLYYPTARAEHRGKYLCRAENVAGEDVRVINVKISFHPRVTADEKIVGQMVGYRKELLCDVTAYPEPKEEGVGWTGPAYKPDDPNFEVTFSKGANNRVTTKLVIRRVRREDYGKYICSGSNSKGNGEFTITLEATNYPTPDRTGQISGVSSAVSCSLLSFVMIFTVFLLHRP